MISQHIKEHEVLGVAGDLRDFRTHKSDETIHVTQAWKDEVAAHEADGAIHVTQAWKTVMEGKSAVYYRATIDERNALTGIHEGDLCRVKDDGTGHFATFIYTNTGEWDVLSEETWENINISWGSITGVPSFAEKDTNGCVTVATATDGSHAVNKNQLDLAISEAEIGAGSGGDLFGPSSSVADNYSAYADATGKTLIDSGVKKGHGSVLDASYIATGDVLETIRGNMSASVIARRMFDCASVCTGMPSAVAHSITGEGTQSDLTLFARPAGANGKALWVRRYYSSAWESAWTQVYDAYGRSIKNTIISVASGVSVKTTILANVGIEQFHAVVGATGGSDTTTAHKYRVEWIDAATLTCRVIEYMDGSFYTCETYCSGGTWYSGGWINTVTADGKINATYLGGHAASYYAVDGLCNAAYAVNAKHQKNPGYISGTYTQAQIATALKNIFGASAWDLAVQGAWGGTSINGVISRMYCDGSAVYMQYLSNIGNDSTFELTVTSPSNKWSISF